MTGFLWLLLTLACKDKEEGDDTSATDDTAGETGDTSADVPTQEELFAKWVNVTDAAVGDLTCYDGATWNTETPDAACQMEAEVSEGKVVEFAFETTVPTATVNFYYADAVGGAADVSVTTDAYGVFTGSIQTCTPLTYEVTAGEDFRPTYQFHEVYDYETPQTLDLISVSQDTWVTLPSLFGVIIDEGAGVVAGSVEDCNGDVIENAQVLLRDADGNIPADMTIGFTFNGLPSRVYTATSSDGIWMAMNVPPGDYTVELYVSDGAGGQTIVGKAPVQAFAGSVSVVVMNAGIEDGIDLPGSCSCGAE